MSDNKRKFMRIPFKMAAEIKFDDITYPIEEIINLSIGGCLIPVQAKYNPGTECTLTIMIGSSNSDLNIRIMGKVVRCLPENIAVQFIGIEPDSLFHLQNVIRYNSEDPDKVEAEINEHPGLK